MKLPYVRAEHIRGTEILWSDTLKQVYNPTKHRMEFWARRDPAWQWLLFDAFPAKIWVENLLWMLTINGDPAPDFDFNAIPSGAGFILRCLAGGVNTDWIAMSTWEFYITRVARSPHLYIYGHLLDPDNCRCFLGLVGPANLETGDDLPWTTPDDGIWLEYDTNVSADMRFVTSSGGVQTVTPLPGVPIEIGREHVIRVNDAGDEATLIIDGQILATHDTNLPTPTLDIKPLLMVGHRDLLVKDYMVNNWFLINDDIG